MGFENKVIVITGAGGGIGSATAIHFAKSKAKLSIVDINKIALENTAKQCLGTGLLKSNICTIAADLNKLTDVKSVISETVKHFGQIDVLINNAGISSKDTIKQENFLENYDLTFNVNLKAPMLLLHLAVPYLTATKGNVVNITSVGGIHPLPDLLMYNASKAALRHFTKCVALELAPIGIRVNSIAPAGVKTDMVKLLGITDVEEFQHRRAQQLPLQRMVECEEVASVIAFLASDDAKSITGTELIIDAGHLLGGGTPQYSDKS